METTEEQGNPVFDEYKMVQAAASTITHIMPISLGNTQE
jgi:hypothetical protein